MQEMEEISMRRRKKHKNLITTVAAKVNLIKRERQEDKNIDYEYYLMMKDDFHYESLSSEEGLSDVDLSDLANSIKLKTKSKSANENNDGRK